MNFDHYYRGGRFTQTAEFVEFCKPLLPKYIDTILEFGCANGRDFIPSTSCTYERLINSSTSWYQLNKLINNEKLEVKESENLKELISTYEQFTKNRTFVNDSDIDFIKKEIQEK